MKVLIHSTMDVPDLARSEWSRIREEIKEDANLIYALEQLEKQTMGQFCASPNYDDVYSLFETLHFSEEKHTPACKFAGAFLSSYPNFDPFLMYKCSPVFGRSPISPEELKSTPVECPQ